MINSVTKEQIKSILDNAKIEIRTVLGKCTVVAAQLANGFIIIESSACVDPANYDEKLGAEICLERIENKLWELEGYKLQDSTYNKKQKRELIVNVKVDCNIEDIKEKVNKAMSDTFKDLSKTINTGTTY